MRLQLPNGSSISFFNPSHREVARIEYAGVEHKWLGIDNPLTRPWLYDMFKEQNKLKTAQDMKVTKLSQALNKMVRCTYDSATINGMVGIVKKDEDGDYQLLNNMYGSTSDFAKENGFKFSWDIGSYGRSAPSYSIELIDSLDFKEAFVGCYAYDAEFYDDTKDLAEAIDKGYAKRVLATTGELIALSDTGSDVMLDDWYTEVDASDYVFGIKSTSSVEEVKEFSMEEVAEAMGVDVDQLRIKKED